MNVKLSSGRCTRRIEFIQVCQVYCTHSEHTWNSLPNSVVDVDTVDVFKARLDKFWLHQNVKYGFVADLSGINYKSVHGVLHNGQ